MNVMKALMICFAMLSGLALAATTHAGQHSPSHMAGTPAEKPGGMHAVPNTSGETPGGMKHAPAMPGMMEGKADGMMHGCMMQAMMNEGMRMNKNFSDKAFLSAMIPHHEAAVAMANDVLKKGKDAQVKKWAQAIVNTQEEEIRQMRAWLEPLGGVDAAAADAMKTSMHAMMAAPSAFDPDVNFVTMMVGHHAGAVEMAASAAIASENEELAKFAEKMAKTQLEEIMEYRGWLKNKG